LLRLRKLICLFADVYGQECHDPMALYLHTFGTEVSMGSEAPVKRSIKKIYSQMCSEIEGMNTPNNPILEALDISCDHVVNLWAPRWELLLISRKRIDGLRTEFASIVNSALKVVTVVFHEYADHVVSIASSLFLVVRENILLR
jgi:hypothetical protein